MLLVDQGVYDEVLFAATKKVLAAQVADAMKEQHITKTEMARRMKTSRASLNRLIDPDSQNVTLQTMSKAAKVLGRRIQIEVV